MLKDSCTLFRVFNPTKIGNLISSVDFTIKRGVNMTKITPSNCIFFDKNSPLNFILDKGVFVSNKIL
jgi:hypothetical protein